jgi:hypothetical protein
MPKIMTRAASVHELPIARESDYLGPGRVIRVEPTRVAVTIRGAVVVEAELALSVRYTPVVGDVLLVIGRGEDHYVIGVIDGKGHNDLSFSGGVTLRAQGGPLTLVSDTKVSLAGPEVEVETSKLNVFAGAVVERLMSLVQTVRGALNVRAGKMNTVVDDSSFLTAKSASIVTEETVTINGDEIHLG